MINSIFDAAQLLFWNSIHARRGDDEILVFKWACPITQLEVTEPDYINKEGKYHLITAESEGMSSMVQNGPLNKSAEGRVYLWKGPHVIIAYIIINININNNDRLLYIV